MRGLHLLDSSLQKNKVGNDQQVAQLDDIQQKAGATALQQVPLLALLAGPARLLWPDRETRWCQQLHGQHSELTRDKWVGIRWLGCRARGTGSKGTAAFCNARRPSSLTRAGLTAARLAFTA